MRCSKVQRLLASYLDGQLPPRHHDAVEVHVDGCDRCAEHARTIRRLYGMLDTQKPATLLPHVFEARVMERIRRLEEAGREPRRDRRVVAVIGAGVVGVLLGAGLDRIVLSPPSPWQDAQRDPAVATQESAVTVAQGQAMVEEPMGEPEAAAPVSLMAAESQTESSAAEENAGGDGAPELPLRLRDSLDLFVDFPIIRDLDKFENFDSIWAGRGDRADGARGG